ncbi:lengsin-like [Amphiura filiformis]|uniref:lengsin-like n=1 Tax=Amphiura filiformis TaxID=82378 RepID=UPI003B228A36
MEKQSTVLSEIRNNNIEYIRMELSDQYGIARSKTIPARHFKRKTAIGQNFSQLSYAVFDPHGEIVMGTGYLEEINCRDATCFPDLDTFAILPWVKNTARVILNPTYKGEAVIGSPREVCKRQYARLTDMGYSLMAAHEHEFYLETLDTKKPAFETYHFQSTIRSSFNLPFTQQIERDLFVAGVDIESIEVEYCPGQMEISYSPTFGIRAADNAHTYRTAIKEIARQHNYRATFMTKPDPKALVASGAHLNHSLWDADGKVSLFYDADAQYGLSKVGQHWMAGILEHAPAITLLSAPTINCLSRYQLNSWSPVNNTWGLDNRSCLLRAKVSDQNGTYVENRLPGAGGSPYLSLTGMIIAGMDGIERKLPLPEPVNGSAYDKKNLPSTGVKGIPNTMKGALDEFLKDKVIIEALGSEFIQVFVALKKHEMKCQEDAKAKGDVDWEKNYYSYL